MSNVKIVFKQEGMNGENRFLNVDNVTASETADDCFVCENAKERVVVPVENVLYVTVEKQEGGNES